MANAAAEVAVKGIRQIAINVQELERAKQFYRDTLGLTFLFEVPGLAFFDAGGVRLMLGKAERTEHDHPGSILYYTVSNIQKSHESLARNGARVEREPEIVAPMPDHDLWISFYQDTEGNYFGLMSEVPR